MIDINETEVEKLISEYGGVLYGFCKKLTSCLDEADDLFQQTFLKAFENRLKIKADGSPKSFLVSLATGIWKNNCKKSARHQRIAPTSVINDDELHTIKSNELDALEQLVSNELKHEVNEIVNNLDDKLKLPVIMYYSIEMQLGEIASALNIPQGTVKSRLYKARNIIKKKLEVKGYGEN